MSAIPGLFSGTASAGGGAPTGAAGGDLGGTYPNPTVPQINGATVPLGGALTTGNGLHVSGAATLTYSALNLAGGAGYVSGVLPAANLPSASTSATGIVQLATDLGGTSTAPTVVSATGAAGVLALAATANIITWAAATTAPGIAQTAATSGVGATMLIKAQAGFTGSNGGVLSLSSGTGTVAGNVQIQTGAVNAMVFSPTTINTPTGTLTFGDSTTGNKTPATTGLIALPYHNSAATNIWPIMTARDSGGTDRDILKKQGDQINIGTSGLQTSLNGASASTTTAVDWTLQHNSFRLQNQSNAFENLRFTFVNTANPATMSWATGLSGVTMSQADKTTASGTGATTTIQAQNETGTTSTGGNLALQAGTGTTAYGDIVTRGSLVPGVISTAMADANQTVSAANSVSAIYIATSATATATRTLTISTPPTAGKIIFFRNMTSVTPQSITVQFSSGTGVTVLAATSATIYADGTNAVLLMTGT